MPCVKKKADWALKWIEDRESTFGVYLLKNLFLLHILKLGPILYSCVENWTAEVLQVQAFFVCTFR